VGVIPPSFYAQKTVDQYFSGANDTIQHAGVRNIIDSVITSLERNPARTFTYVEQAFFQRWWRELAPERRALTRRLVAQGRLEFTNGGWCMHDEVRTHPARLQRRHARL